MESRWDLFTASGLEAERPPAAEPRARRLRPGCSPQFPGLKASGTWRGSGGLTEALQAWLPCHVCVMRWQRGKRLGLRPVFWPVDIWMIDSLTLDKVPTEGRMVTVSL